MTLDTSGNVGIGTSSPSGASGKTLAINGGSGQTRLALKNTSTGDASGDGFQISIGTDGSAGIEQRENNYMAFSTNATERMRLDTSGNVLVGKTAQNSDNAGVELRAGGQTTATRSASWVGLFNRLTDDGDIVRFQKDSTTVGSIGTAGADLAIGTGASAIRFRDSVPELQPWNVTTNAAVNGTIDIGGDGRSFKDLYLSGGVYLGGTGSANKLDDYEEGSFTPQLDTTNLVGYYTKIGNLCYFTIWGNDTNDSDNDITGLPFTASNRNYAGVITFGRSRGVDWYDSNGVPCRAYVNNGSTSITFRTNRVSGDDASFTITTTAVSDWSISGVYQTT
jgi:hypothetical protein